MYLYSLKEVKNKQLIILAKIVGVFGLIWKLYLFVVLATTTLFMHPIIWLFLFSEKGRKKAFKLFVIWSWTFRLLGFYQVKKLQEKALPKGPFILVGNHISYLDIFLLYSIFPSHPFLFLGKSEILSYPFFRTYFKALNIPVYRNDKIKSGRSIVQTYRKIEKGWSIVIFPEGGIPSENNPHMIPFKEGAFQIAKRAGLPIVPITFINNHKLFSDPTNLLGPASPGVSKVHIHSYITKEEVSGLSINALKNKCFDIINAPLKQANS